MDISLNRHRFDPGPREGKRTHWRVGVWFCERRSVKSDARARKCQLGVHKDLRDRRVFLRQFRCLAGNLQRWGVHACVYARKHGGGAGQVIYVQGYASNGYSESRWICVSLNQFDGLLLLCQLRLEVLQRAAVWAGLQSGVHLRPKSQRGHAHHHHTNPYMPARHMM